MRYLKEVLDNGMTIAIVPLKTAEMSCGFFVNAGLKNETKINNGISHFLEHMTFRGTKTRSAEDIVKELSKLGHEYNAATTARHTYYYFNGDAENMKKTIDLLIDIYVNPALKKRDIDIEKKVILEEMRLINDRPTHKLHKSMTKKFLSGTSLAMEIIGTEDTVNGITKEDFLLYRKQHYTPDNTVFVITGNINPLPVMKILHQYLSELKNPLSVNKYDDSNDKLTIMKNIMQQDKPFLSINKNTTMQQAYVLVCFPITDLLIDFMLEIEMIMYILANGEFDSRLVNALRTKNGITYVVDSSIEKFYDVGMFMLEMAMNPDQLLTGINIIFRELEKMKKEPVTLEERSKAIDALDIDDFPEDAHSTLIYFGIGCLENRDFLPVYNDYHEKLSKITRDKLLKVANMLFQKNRTNLFIYGNVDESIADKIIWMN